MTEKRYDVVIIGSGPAGLQAAIHASRRKATVLVLGKVPKSSAYNAHIDNYCCVNGSSGADLLNQARLKTEKSGAHFLEEDVTALSQDNGFFTVTTESERKLEAASIILAMGVSRNRLGLANEKKLIGRGISYCVDCDAGFFKDQTVAVIGSESAAVSGALTLLFFAGTVHLVSETLDINPVLTEKLKESSVIVHEGRKPIKIIGEAAVEELVLDNDMQIPVDGIFIELGAKGAISLAAGLGVALDSSMKYIAVNRKQETNIRGIYAAGDICGAPWQIAKAVGEGCVAGLEAAAFAKRV